jgi:hypothetical protein
LKYRPWGNIDWVLSLSAKKEWGFVGTIGTEERSLCAWKLMKQMGLLQNEMIFKVNDIYTSKYKDKIEDCLNKRYADLELNGGISSDVEGFDLMSELFKVNALCKKITNLGSSIILDITSMPKRFYFPILRMLVLDNKVKNLVITYTSPASYTDGLLYEDIDIWKNLPGFGGEGSLERENLIVSIGFLVESLNNYLSTAPEHGKVNILVPFPAPLAILKRTWASVSNIERDQDSNRFDKVRVDTLDMSTAFDYIKSIASNSNDKTAFAPFGPKTFSVAMCLYSILENSAVYYPQPTVYHPEYSVGIKNDDPNTAVNAYWIKHDGNNLYTKYR